MSTRAVSSFLALAALATIAMGCSKDSSDLSTSGIRATYFVELDPLPAPGTTVVTAHLEDPDAPAGTGDIKLSNGDGLSVTTDKNDNLPMGSTGADGDYSATLMNLDRNTFTFHLKRSSGTSSDNSVISIPPSLVLTDSPDKKTYAATDTIHFAWSNQESDSKITLSADHRDCSSDIAIKLGDTSVKDLPFPDSGTLDIEVTKLYSASTPASADCVDISVKRLVGGRADSALESTSGMTASRVDHYTIHIK